MKKNLKILITGSEGSLMQSVIPKLLKQNHIVIGVDNLYRYGIKKGEGYEFCNVDLADRKECLTLFSDIDCVIHAAAKIYGVGGFNEYCADILSDDITVTGNVLHACAKFGIKKIIYISSSMVYETCVQDVNFPVTEDMVNDCSLPKTDYGLSKLLGERLCQAFQKQYGINYTIWRPFNIITPHELADKEQGHSHVFADFIKNIVVEKKTPLPIFGSGEQVRCFTWIDDIANIIANYSFDDRTINQAFNICNVEPISMKDLAKKIHSRISNSELKFETVNNFKNDVLVRIPSIAKLTSTLGDQTFQSVDISLDTCMKAYT